MYDKRIYTIFTAQNWRKYYHRGRLSLSLNFYSTLHFCSQKKKVAAGTLVLSPVLASNLTYKKFWQKNEVKGI
jgi:hypothetical protein